MRAVSTPSMTMRPASASTMRKSASMREDLPLQTQKYKVRDVQTDAGARPSIPHRQEMAYCFLHRTFIMPPLPHQSPRHAPARAASDADLLPGRDAHGDALEDGRQLRPVAHDEVCRRARGRHPTSFRLETPARPPPPPYS